MIGSFEVENFRLFDHLRINKLNRVNLIVGKNNAGKSALLEAILLYYTDVSRSVINELLRYRDEQRNLSGTSSSNKYTTPLKHLFKNHEIPNVGSDGFKLRSDNVGEEIHVKTAAYFIHVDEEGTRSRKRISDEDVSLLDESDYDLYLVTESADGTKTLAPLTGRRGGLLPRPIIKSYQYLPPQGITNKKAATLWDDIALTEFEDYVIEGLKLIEPSLSGLTLVDQGSDKSIRIPVVRCDHFNERVPLKSLGDGMTRIFHIILCLVSCQNGILEIDEFDNGLHWEVQPEVWRIIFQMADALNVQVFVTTHSRDCIQAFADVWKHHESDASFVRISKDENRERVQEYDLKLLSNSIELGVEVR